MRLYVEVWVCTECGNYYGSSTEDGRDLSKMMNYSRQETTVNGNRVWANVPTHARSRCPSCHADRRMHRAFLMGISTTEEERLATARQLATEIERRREEQ